MALVLLFAFINIVLLFRLSIPLEMSPNTVVLANLYAIEMVIETDVME